MAALCNITHDIQYRILFPGEGTLRLMAAGVRAAQHSCSAAVASCTTSLEAFILGQKYSTWELWIALRNYNRPLLA